MFMKFTNIIIPFIIFSQFTIVLGDEPHAGK